MHAVNPPDYPETIADEYFRYTTNRAEGFAGLQIRNGPYGGLSSDGASDGSVHFCCDREMSSEEFLEIVDWVSANSEKVLDSALASFVDQYWEMRDLVLECLIDKDPDDVVPKIKSHNDLRRLCGIVAVHIKGYGPNRTPRFGIEFGCTWEAEHGAGARFEGTEVIESGYGSDAFDYQ
jgi:hypothetical protein